MENDIFFGTRLVTSSYIKSFTNSIDEFVKDQQLIKAQRLEKYIELMQKHYPDNNSLCIYPHTDDLLKNMDTAINLLLSAGLSRDEAERGFLQSVEDYKGSEVKDD